MHKIILIGLPGSGKTSAGRHVARHFSWPFVDTDQAIEAALGQSIKDYFAEAGEQAFRDLETAALRQLLDQPAPFVLSTGGGAVLRPENRELMPSAGTVIYLQAMPETIFRRLRHDKKRPLLQVPNPKAKLEELFDARDPLYRETAHHVLACGKKTLNELVQDIIELVNTESEAPQESRRPRLLRP